MSRRICYAVHWKKNGPPESRIYDNLGSGLVEFMRSLENDPELKWGPEVERVILSELTKVEKETLRKLRRQEDGHPIPEGKLQSQVPARRRRGHGRSRGGRGFPHPDSGQVQVAGD